MKINTKTKDIVNWIEVSDIWGDLKESEFTFIDLFSGAGGMSKGFEMAGFEGIYGLDHFDSAVATYQRNFNHPIFNGDITLKKVKREFIKLVNDQLLGRKLNVMVGGFPCQGFSLSGHRVVADPRNSLYLDMLSIVTSLFPDFCCFRKCCWFTFNVKWWCGTENY